MALYYGENARAPRPETSGSSCAAGRAVRRSRCCLSGCALRACQPVVANDPSNDVVVKTSDEVRTFCIVFLLDTAQTP